VGILPDLQLRCSCGQRWTVSILRSKVKVVMRQNMVIKALWESVGHAFKWHGQMAYPAEAYQLTVCRQELSRFESSHAQYQWKVLIFGRQHANGHIQAASRVLQTRRAIVPICQDVQHGWVCRYVCLCWFLVQFSQLCNLFLTEYAVLIAVSVNFDVSLNFISSLKFAGGVCIKLNCTLNSHFFLFCNC